MQADLGTLKKQVLEAAKRPSIKAQIEDVLLEPDRDDDGADFLRVLVQVKHSPPPADEDLEDLLEAIEDAVSEIDERYPSVRFADAA